MVLVAVYRGGITISGSVPAIAVALVLHGSSSRSGHGDRLAAGVPVLVLGRRCSGSVVFAMVCAVAVAVLGVVAVAVTVLVARHASHAQQLGHGHLGGRCRVGARNIVAGILLGPAGRVLRLVDG